MTTTSYDYSSRDRLIDKNTYFYTPAVGMPMIDAWSESRRTVLENLPSPLPPPESKFSTKYVLNDNENIVTANLLEYLWSRSFESELDPDESIWLEKLMKKFELTKHFYRSYDSCFRIVDKSQFKDMELYIRAAEIFLSAYDRSSDIRFLNVLLKILDTLCSVYATLSPGLCGRLAQLLLNEEKKVADLIAKQ